MSPALRERLAALPRTELARLPTPLLPLPRLAASQGGPELLVKMDAETGFALGGNKVRKLEHELAPDRLEDVTCLVTAGGPQSNHCRVTAAAAARLGLRCVLVIDGPAPEGRPRGNALLHRLFGAEIRRVAERALRAPTLDAVAREEAQAGGKALVLPLGASTPLGALGYARAAAELDAELPADGRETWIFVASSSCGTLGGLAAGFTLLDRGDVRLVGVSADTPRAELLSEAGRLARGAMALLGATGDPRAGLLEADDTQIGEGYGVPTEASAAALERFARREGIVLDPVYTAKAAAGFLSWVEGGRVGPGERALFLHTGGHPALLT